MVAVWIVGALRTKPTARTEPSARRIGHMGTVIVAAWLMFSHRMPDILKVRVIPASFATGVVLTWAGLAFAIWARFTLGSNWSGVVEVIVVTHPAGHGPGSRPRDLVGNAGQAIRPHSWIRHVAG